MKRELKDLTTKEKALQLNLQPTIYGSFAEIGAGQEVANQFFKAGAASGTIAKTISAYDMTVSDSIYGKTRKYVSKSRVESMLDVEYEDIHRNLTERAAQKQFFVYANTIETINFHKTNRGQGWMGVRFQLTPNSPPSTCIVHIILHTDDVEEQRRITGKLGVNLIYAAYNYYHSPELFVNNLKQNISTEHVEVNFIEVYGNQFDKEINLHMTLQLVKSNLTKMVMLGNNGEVLQPSNALYKKDVVLVRGRFRPPTKVTQEMFLKSQNQLVNDQLAEEHSIQAVAEITFQCFQDHKELELEEFLRRTRYITELGYPLMVTNFTYHHELIGFMQQQIRTNSLNVVLGLDNMRKVVQDDLNYNALEGLLQLTLLAAKDTTRLLVFPELNPKQELVGLESLQLSKAILSLLEFLRLNNTIHEIEEVDKSLLGIRSDKVLHAISNNDSEWLEQVPHQLIALINEEMGRVKAS